MAEMKLSSGFHLSLRLQTKIKEPGFLGGIALMGSQGHVIPSAVTECVLRTSAMLSLIDSCQKAMKPSIYFPPTPSLHSCLKPKGLHRHPPELTTGGW